MKSAEFSEEILGTCIDIPIWRYGQQKRLLDTILQLSGGYWMSTFSSTASAVIGIDGNKILYLASDVKVTGSVSPLP